ncbi:MAG: tRNA (adenosine(37)-N6)-threonylcarbamoyltransferase complex ATPase subunit type 1 TsaE [Chloroflexi bacterium]|nr:tRNA (adenosine(37)-N6)-threonylcarbamoyltransferase complex ATPase subunit type 1 TsaE [Chloroflexota bacterium]
MSETWRWCVTPIITENALDVITHSPKQTHLLGARLGALLRPGDVVCLQGDLGTGKTCLTQGIGAGLDVVGVIHSPTFVYINEHQPANVGPYLYHVDLYRIQDYFDALSLGLEDYVYGNGVTVIEWAERAIEIIPAQRLWVTLTYLDHTKRRLFFEASGARYREILRTLERELYGRPSPPTDAQPLEGCSA